jgi:hypothetical protein
MKVVAYERSVQGTGASAMLEKHPALFMVVLKPLNL